MFCMVLGMLSRVAEPPDCICMTVSIMSMPNVGMLGPRVVMNIPVDNAACSLNGEMGEVCCIIVTFRIDILRGMAEAARGRLMGAETSSENGSLCRHGECLGQHSLPEVTPSSEDITNRDATISTLLSAIAVWLRRGSCHGFRDRLDGIGTTRERDYEGNQQDSNDQLHNSPQFSGIDHGTFSFKLP